MVYDKDIIDVLTDWLLVSFEDEQKNDALFMVFSLLIFLMLLTVVIALVVTNKKKTSCVVSRKLVLPIAAVGAFIVSLVLNVIPALITIGLFVFIIYFSYNKELPIMYEEEKKGITANFNRDRKRQAKAFDNLTSAQKEQLESSIVPFDNLTINYFPKFFLITVVVVCLRVAIFLVIDF